jgi:hypothetical protein
VRDIDSKEGMEYEPAPAELRVRAAEPGLEFERHHPERMSRSRIGQTPTMLHIIRY